MSFVYDVMAQAWSRLSESLPDSEAKTRFGLLIGAMHEANHKAKDVINHDPTVRVQADRLDAALKAQPAPQSSPERCTARYQMTSVRCALGAHGEETAHESLRGLKW